MWKKPLTSPFVDSISVTYQDWYRRPEEWEKTTQTLYQHRETGAQSSDRGNLTTVFFGGQLLAAERFETLYPKVHASMYPAGKSPEPRVTRADVACDYLIKSHIRPRDIAKRLRRKAGRMKTNVVISPTEIRRQKPGEKYGQGWTLYKGSRKSGRYQLRVYAKTATDHHAARTRWSEYPGAGYQVVRVEVEMGRKVGLGFDQHRIVRTAAEKVNQWLPLEWPEEDGYQVAPDQLISGEGMFFAAIRDLSRLVGRLQAIAPGSVEAILPNVRYSKSIAEKTRKRTQQRMARTGVDIHEGVVDRAVVLLNELG